MKAERLPTANGIDDIKLIGENDLERQFIKQLAEAGTLSCQNRQVSDTVLFRPISVVPDLSSVVSSDKKSIGKYDFTIRQNEGFVRDFAFERNGAPMDLSIYTEIKTEIKYSKSAAAIISLSLGSGLAVSGSDSNILKMTIPAAQTKLLNRELYYYDIMFSTPTTTIYFQEGKITVKNTGTR
jgi:hypothetical protein